MKKLVATFLLVAAIPLAGIMTAGPVAGVSAQGESIIRNGSFESPVAQPGTYRTFFAGHRFGHWMVTRGSIDLIGGGYWQAAKGGQSVDLSGLGERGIIRQRLHALMGQTYTLRFALAGNPEGLPAVKKMSVKWEGAPVAHLTFDTTGRSNQDMGWTYHSFVLTATSPNPVLKFVSQTHIGCGPVLDDVSLVPVVG